MTVKYSEERIEEIDKHANQSLINIADARSDLEYLLEIAKAYKEAVGVIEFYSIKENHHNRTETLSCGCCSDIIDSIIDEDEGQRALDFFKKHEVMG